MATLASTILSEVSEELHDTSNVRWLVNELLEFINDGQRTIVLIRADATSSTKARQLVAGVYQAIPSDGYQFLKLLNNMGTDGLSEGRHIQFIELSALNRHDPLWRTRTASAVVVNFAYDALDREHFYVSPPVPASPDVYVTEQYSRLPVDIPLTTDNPSYFAAFSKIDLNDIYKPHLIDYVLYRAYRKQAEAASRTKAAAHADAFLSMLGAKDRKDLLVSPEIRDRPHSDTIPRPAAVGE